MNLITIMIAALLLVGCGSNSSDPEEVAYTYLQRMLTDAAAAYSMLSPAAKDSMAFAEFAVMSQMAAGFMKQMEITPVIDSVVTASADTCRVYYSTEIKSTTTGKGVSNNPAEKPKVLVRIDGEWFVDTP